MGLIANLVARFSADTTAFERNTQRARQSLRGFAAEGARTQQALLGIVRGAAGFLGIGVGIYSIKRAFESVTKAAMEQEKAEAALSAAIDSKSIGTFKAYSEQMQRLTIYGDEQILSQMAYAKNLGVTKDKLEEATTAAIGLAARYRIDLESAMMLVGRASQGQTQMLARYGIILDKSLSDQEKFNALLKIGADSFCLAEKETKTAAGAFAQYHNVMGELKEDIGFLVLPALTDFAKGISKITNEVIISKQTLEEYRKLTGDINAEKFRIPTWMPLPSLIGGMEEEKYPEILEMMRRQAAAGLEPGLTLPPEVQAGVTGKWLERQKKATKDLKEEISKEQAEMDRLTNSLKVEMEMLGHLNETRERARDVIKFQTAAEEKYGENTEKAIQSMKEYMSIYDEFEKRQRWAKVAEDMGESFAKAFESMIFEARKFGDVFDALMRDIAMSVMRRTITEPLALALTGVFGGIFGSFFTGTPAITGQQQFENMGIDVGVGHSGGMIGEVSTKRMIPLPSFIGAPRLHRGLAPDEFPFIGQRGERILPKGAQMSPPVVIINNNSNVSLRQAGPSRFDGEKWIVALETTLDDRIHRGEGPLRQTIRGIR